MVRLLPLEMAAQQMNTKR